MMESAYFLGLDLGQAQDYTALCVAEARTLWNWGNHRPGHGRAKVYDAPSYHVRHLERLQLGTRYTSGVRRVADVLGKLPGSAETALVVDATGVGLAVVDMFAEAGLRPIAVTITGGHETNRTSWNRYSVPKVSLIGVLQRLLGEGRLKVASELAEAATLVGELQTFKVKITPSARQATYEHWRDSDHDDLVLATALACWYPEHGRSRARAGTW